MTAIPTQASRYHPEHGRSEEQDYCDPPGPSCDVHCHCTDENDPCPFHNQDPADRTPGDLR